MRETLSWWSGAGCMPLLLPVVADLRLDALLKLVRFLGAIHEEGRLRRSQIPAFAHHQFYQFYEWVYSPAGGTRRFGDRTIAKDARDRPQLCPRVLGAGDRARANRTVCRSDFRISESDNPLSQHHPVQGRARTRHARAGKNAEARALLDELKTLSKGRYVSGCDLAAFYAGLGEKDQALAWLEKAHEQHDYTLISAKVLPLFDPLRSDPRFQDLLRRVGLPQ